MQYRPMPTMLSNYMSVSRALEGLNAYGTVLGNVINHPLADGDARRYPKVPIRVDSHSSTYTPPLWARQLGCKLGALQSLDGKFAMRGTANISGPVGAPPGRAVGPDVSL